MFDYRDEFQRRIAQFASYLESMNHRSHEIAHCPCFMIFEEFQGDGSTGEELAEKRQLALEAVRSAFLQVGGSGISDPDNDGPFDLPDEGWRGDDSANRFIQFSFEEKRFCIDMPIETLFRPEAAEILRHRTGFFYLADRKEFTLYGEDVEGHDPFRKIYLYGDERSAAEDMAFVFFQVWKFPVDSRLYVSSAAFGDNKHEWEQGVPIE